MWNERNRTNLDTEREKENKRHLTENKDAQVGWEACSCRSPSFAVLELQLCARTVSLGRGMGIIFHILKMSLCVMHV